MNQDLTPTDCLLFDEDKLLPKSDLLTPEQEVTILWPDTEPARLWAFPQDLSTLVRGYCLLEFCSPAQQPQLIEQKDYKFELKPLPRKRAQQGTEPGMISPQLINSKMEEFLSAKGKWELTGCFHRALAFNLKGHSIWVEDIGRHNCLDRLAGRALQQRRNLKEYILFISARATASLVSKACKCGFKAMISRSAVTTASIAIANENNMTLVGFTRKQRFTVYADPQQKISV